MHVRLVTVARTPDQFRAAIWLSVLESAGIDAELHGAAMGAVYSGVGQVASISVVVREEDLEEARALLDPSAAQQEAGPGSAAGRPRQEPTGDS